MEKEKTIKLCPAYPPIWLQSRGWFFDHQGAYMLELSASRPAPSVGRAAISAPLADGRRVLGGDNGLCPDPTTTPSPPTLLLPSAPSLPARTHSRVPARAAQGRPRPDVVTSPEGPLDYFGHLHLRQGAVNLVMQSAVYRKGLWLTAFIHSTLWSIAMGSVRWPNAYCMCVLGITGVPVLVQL